MFRRVSSCLLAASGKSSSSGSLSPPLDINAAYRVLGISSSSSSSSSSAGAPSPTVEHVRQQYLKLARQYHPDLTNGDDTKMKAINLAYEVVQRHAASSSSSSSQQQAQQRAKQSPTKRRRPGASDEDGDDGFGGEKEDGPSRARRPRSPLGDAASWNARPEFEWRAAIFDVNEAEAAHPRNHARAYNRFFSFDDDASIFRAVRSGATVAEVARSMGRTPVAIEARMNSTQFKLRVQKLLKSSPGSGEDGGLNARAEFSRQVHPHHDTVRRTPAVEREGKGPQHKSDIPFLYPEEIGEDEDADLRRFSARNMAGAQSRSYAHLMHYQSRRK